MASLGEVVSTALTGGDAPVFQGVTEDKKVAKQITSTGNAVDAVSAKVDKLEALLTTFLEAQKPVSEDKTEAVSEAPKAKATTKKAAE